MVMAAAAAAAAIAVAIAVAVAVGPALTNQIDLGYVKPRFAHKRQRVELESPRHTVNDPINAFVSPPARMLKEGPEKADASHHLPGGWEK